MAWTQGKSLSTKEDFVFYLGTHMRNWLWKTELPLFVSARRLKTVTTLHPRPPGARWALDSGGFTELNLYGRWETPVADYVAQVGRFSRELGGMDWAAPMDWMCEPSVLQKTGLTVLDHQQRTIDNFIALRSSAEGGKFIPVLQGWEPDDYLRCREMYESRGVDLSKEWMVGVGTVCRRQSTSEAKGIFVSLGDLNLHGFGVKGSGLKKYRDVLASADSMAWSFSARRARVRLEGCPHSTCANCLLWARKWMDDAIGRS